MSYINRYTNELIKLRKENIDLKKGFFERIVQILPILIPLLVAYFGFIQFLSNQNLIDKRKYNNSYYDERIKVLKAITKSMAEVSVTMGFSDSLENNKMLSTTIKNEFINFNYAKLMLDSRLDSDKKLISDINSYENIVYNATETPQQSNFQKINQLSDNIITECGDILRHEKDSINSYNFKFFPF